MCGGEHPIPAKLLMCGRSRVRGEWGRSARARDPGEIARAWHARRAGDPLGKFAKTPQGKLRTQARRSKRTAPFEGGSSARSDATPLANECFVARPPADCRAHRVPETRAKTHLRVVPTAPRTAPGRASPDASAKRSLGAAPPAPQPHRTVTARTCARAPRRAHPRFRPWSRGLISTALHGIPSRPFTRPTP